MGKNRLFMKWNIRERRTRLLLLGAVILLVGWGGAAVLYWTAGDGSDLSAGYEMAGGTVYPVAPEHSKMYVHDLEVFGGRSAVLSNAISRWFAGLWHGKSLALTVACASGLISFGIFFVVTRVRPGLKTGERDEDTRDKTREDM